ncbi:hypothetical protein GAB14E_0874 [Colwellia psychrerythraea]|uniref:Uncharacterized protein n=1 Tax=Colwellia psychrerythraea TaxID=28229 RepID=A0A099L6X8_COLPS|nr:hypothetical protein GAB14E_0874 [Colwellia psychrerythraea]
MRTSYRGKEYNFNGFEELWAFYRRILVQQSHR